MLLWWLVVLLILILAIESKCDSNEYGHLEKLGSHRDPLGVTHAARFLSPTTFFRNFVVPGNPVLLKGALREVNHPGLDQWTDYFLHDKFGMELVKVEHRHVEDRALPSSWITLRQFVNTYQTEDIYMVHSLRNKMEELALIPSTLQCGGFQKQVQEAVMWMGSGETSSVLHKDPLDNLLCLFSGRKDFFLIDKAYIDDVEKDGFVKTGGYSEVDPKRVDLKKFPRLANVPWHEVTMGEGDCLYIPASWYHQVTSTGIRHASVNLWFSPLWWFNDTDCPMDTSLHQPLEPISTFGFASPNEAYRAKLLSALKNRGLLTRLKFYELLPTKPAKDRAAEFFNIIDQNSDGALSWGELYSFDIDHTLSRFWDLFDFTEGDAMPEESDEIVEMNHNNQGPVDGNRGFKDTDETDREDHVTSIPLPDSTSGDTPSLPDDSVVNHDQEEEQDFISVDKDIEDDSTCRVEGDLNIESKEFDEFVGLSSQDTTGDRDDEEKKEDLDLSSSVHSKISKDEL